MKSFLLLTGVAILVGFGQSDPEHPNVRTSSSEFTTGAPAAVDELMKSGFGDRLKTPHLGSVSSEELTDTVQTITRGAQIDNVESGQRGVTYDVILQPGHYGRKTGAVGTSGKRVSEQTLVAYITNVIATRLRAEHLSVLVVSADDYLRPRSVGDSFDGLKAKVFLAVHADGSVKPCTTGPSLAYKSAPSILAMHTVGLSLAASTGEDYSKFRHDNFTANEAHYYMFRQVEAPKLTGLLEVGELTCEAKEEQLIRSSNLIGQNLALALSFIVKLPTKT